jgi:hypothetical protein
MKNITTKFTKYITYLAIAALVGVTTTYAIGSLTPTGTAGDQTQYTLNDIYTKLTTGTATSTASGTISVPETVSATFHTLTEIYNAIPPLLSLDESTTTVPVGINISTTTLDAIDSNLVATNIKSGTTIFGVEGSVVEGAPELEWSGEQTQSNWVTASSTCAGLTDGGATAGDWRLPTISELLTAISDDWIIDGGAAPRFADNTHYWSGTEIGATYAWYAYWFGNVSNFDGGKTGTKSVRCVR